MKKDITELDNVAKKDIIKLFVLIALIILTLIHSAQAENMSNYMENNCTSCHALTEPVYKSMGVSERINRKGPPLFFSGNKFRKEWLVSWLQKPVRIRPGGSYPPSHTIVTDEGDFIDEKSLKSHPLVSKKLAEEISDYLLSLRPNDALINQEKYEAKSISLMMGKMNFNKFKGCAACHRDSEDSGGISGPELYTAWLRLKPDFISSYIKNPISWDPYSMMSQKHLKDKDVHKLVDYLKIITEQN